MNKEMIDELYRDMLEDEDLTYLVFFCFGEGLRKLQKESALGRDNETIRIFKRLKNRSGLSKYQSVH